MLCLIGELLNQLTLIGGSIIMDFSVKKITVMNGSMCKYIVVKFPKWIKLTFLITVHMKLCACCILPEIHNEIIYF